MTPEQRMIERRWERQARAEQPRIRFERMDRRNEKELGINEHALTFNSQQLGQIRALLDGTKTEHRLPIVPQPPNDEVVGPEWFEPAVEDRDGYLRAGKPIFGIWDRHGEFGLKCPWLVGDHLWVREAWADLGEDYEKGKSLSGKWLVGTIAYRAGTTNPSTFPGPWKPSIFMPRWASRITLEITGIRAERLGTITTADIIKEGFESRLREHDAVVDLNEKFFRAWDDLHKKGFKSDENPWVWVLEFRRIKP